MSTQTKTVEKESQIQTGEKAKAGAKDKDESLTSNLTALPNSEINSETSMKKVDNKKVLAKNQTIVKSKTETLSEAEIQKKLNQEFEWGKPIEKQPLTKRTKASLIILLFLVPLVIFLGIKIGDRNYLAVSMALLILAMIPFFMIFEDRKPQAKELIIIAVLVGIAVAGRAAFFMLPQFKPVAAIVIISAVSFGAETGFLVGCFSALVSNIFFSQGPWTPWQMFAFGLIGFVAGILFQKGWLKPTRLSLSIFGFFSIFLIFGLIMNPASVLMFMSEPTKEALLASYISGAPVDLVHAISTFLFLFVLSKPFIEKLERIKIKYGLL